MIDKIFNSRLAVTPLANLIILIFVTGLMLFSFWLEGVWC